METYSVVVDAGKPFEYSGIVGDEALEALLKKIYVEEVLPAAADDFPIDVFVYNSKDEDITETQFVSEMIAKIMDTECD